MNVTGGFSKRLHIEQNHSGSAEVMLRDPLLKSAQNYTLQFEDFILGEDVSIFPYQEAPLVTIHSFEGPWSHQYMPSDYEFNGVFNTVSAFVKAFADFLFRFNRTYLTYGRTGNHTFPDYDAVDADMPVDHPDLVGLVYPSYGHTAQVTLTDDNKLSLITRPLFNDNCYFEFSPILQKALGVKQYVFWVQVAVGGGGFLRYSSEDGDALFEADGQIALEVAARATPTVEPRNLLSLNTVDCLDMRVSLDITATLPIARRVSALNGTETHEQLIARFHWNEVDTFEVKTKFENEQRIPQIIEKCVIGQDELTRGSRDTEALHLLPGDIQWVKLDLYSRYLIGGEMQVRPLDIDQGYWAATLHFTKKV